MIDRSRLFVIVAATALAAAPLAAQTSPSNPFGLSQGQRTEAGRPHPRHAWRMERRGERMRWRGERMERGGRWLRAHGHALRGRAYGGRAFGGRAFAHREFAYRGHRWGQRELGAEGRTLGRHHGSWRGHEWALRRGRWNRNRVWREGRLRRANPRPHRDERSRSDGTR